MTINLIKGDFALLIQKLERVKPDKSKMDIEAMSIPNPVPVASYDFIVSLYTELQDLRLRVELLEATQFSWFTRSQAIAFLGTGSTKLWSLKTSGEIKTSGNLYDVQSCRDYLLRNGVSREAINERINSVLKDKQANKIKKNRT